MMRPHRRARSRASPARLFGWFRAGLFPGCPCAQGLEASAADAHRIPERIDQAGDLGIEVADEPRLARRAERLAFGRDLISGNRIGDLGLGREVGHQRRRRPGRLELPGRSGASHRESEQAQG